MNNLLKFCVKLPYELWLTYQGVFEGYIADHKVYYDCEAPPYWYPYYAVASVGYMFRSSATLFDDKLREHYRDKTLKDVVSYVDRHHIDITYEFHKRMYTIRSEIDRMASTVVVNACTTNDSGDEIDVSQHIKRYLGPLEDWHQAKIKPEDLGYSNLTIKAIDQDTLDLVICQFKASDVMPSFRNYING